MTRLQVRLFGGFQVSCDGKPAPGFDIHKVQELFSYLLLHRDRPQPREALAGILWGNCSTAQSRKQLRQALWQLHHALTAQSPSLAGILYTEADCVSPTVGAGLWLDVADFEEKYALARPVPVQDMDERLAQTLQDAVQLYCGELLYGWYQDWCLYERERLQNIYIAMLDKLMQYCEAHRLYRDGIDYGFRILRCDRAREYTYRGIIRQLYLAGDRTAALRQYERCVAALDEELHIRPSDTTRALYQQVQADRFGAVIPSAESVAAGRVPDAGLPVLLERLRLFQAVLVDVQRQLGQDIEMLERAAHND